MRHVFIGNNLVSVKYEDIAVRWGWYTKRYIELFRRELNLPSCISRITHNEALTNFEHQAYMAARIAFRYAIKHHAESSTYYN